jgi:ribosome biogenesis GTPase
MEETTQGRVVATRGRMFDVRLDDGRHIKCEVRGKVKAEADSTPVAVGDRVEITDSHEGGGAIDKVLPRKTTFHRPDSFAGDKKQVIAANIDRLFIVGSVISPELKTGLIDRFLVAAQLGGLEPFILINKTDLGRPDELSEVVAAYRQVGYTTLEVSAESGEGVDQLAELMKEHICLFVGHSGVGKSSLLNQLVPGLDLKTLSISEATNRGRHATTNIELFDLPQGGFIVDSPGLKVMGLWELEADQLGFGYPEFEKYRDNCRFSPCSHTHEPDCAIKTAVEKGEIAEFRYQNYVAIYEDIKNSESDQF